jgi:DNA-binding NtrC family response regulator
MTRVLIVDDDPVQLRLVSDMVARAGYTPLMAGGGEEALHVLREEPGIGAMILDLVMPDRDGLAVLAAMRRDGLGVPVIAQITASSLETVVTALRHGAADFFVKPVSPERLLASLRNVLRIGELEAALRTEGRRRAGTVGLSDIVAESPAMARVLTLAVKAAKTQLPVLIEGEAGTGKQLLARAIHGTSERAGRPFIALDCSTAPDAETALTAKLAEAQGGTLFLAEIGTLSTEAQAKLLDVLQGTSRRVNVRVVAATTSRLLNLAQAGAFREDLYYRLNVLPIYMPPLRDRREDVAPLAAHFLARIAAETGRSIAGLSPAALELLMRYDWPGNIRQLETALYRAAILSATAELDTGDFPQIVARLDGRDAALRLGEGRVVAMAPRHIDAQPPQETAPAAADRFRTEAGDIAPLAEVERALIATALEHHAGHMSRAARALGIGRSTLYRKLKEYGLDTGLESDAA